LGMNFGGVTSDPRRCGSGHMMTQVTRPTGSRWVCPSCLGGVVSDAATRAGTVTVNDYLATVEGGGGDPGRLARRAADAGAKLLACAAELFGEADAASARKVVRDLAKRRGVPTADVMRWPLEQIAPALDEMATAAA
jgi:hypothetical protein